MTKHHFHSADPHTALEARRSLESSHFLCLSRTRGTPRVHPYTRTRVSELSEFHCRRYIEKKNSFRYCMYLYTYTYPYPQTCSNLSLRRGFSPLSFFAAPPFHRRRRRALAGRVAKFLYSLARELANFSTLQQPG